MYNALFYLLFFSVLSISHLSHAASAVDEVTVSASSSIGTVGKSIGGAGAIADNRTGSDSPVIMFQGFEISGSLPTFARDIYPAKETSEGVFTEPYRPTVVFHEGGSADNVDVPDEPSSAETVLMKIIPGRDGRQPIINPARQWPYRVIAQTTSFYNGKKCGGTGTLVGPRHVLTVGHNVFHPRLKKWATNIIVKFSFDGPGMNGLHMPFDKQQVVRAYTYKRWVESLDQDYDIALFVLDHAIGNEIGWHGLASLKITPPPVHIAGYPQAVRQEDIIEPYKDAYKDYVTSKVGPFAQMWTMSSSSHELRVAPNKLYYDIDTSSGQSGSGIWYKTLEDHPYIIGVHAYGEAVYGDGNYGVRINKQKMQDILEWISSTYVVEASSDSLASSTGAGGSASGSSGGAAGASASSVDGGDGSQKKNNTA